MWTSLLVFFCLWEAEKVLSDSSTVGGSSMSLSPSSPTAGLAPSASTNDSVLATVTLDLSYSIFTSVPGNTIEATATADTKQSLQTISSSATVIPRKNCKDINWKDAKCNDTNCVKERMTLMASCIKDKPENLSLSNMDIPEQAMKLGLSLAEAIKEKMERGEPNVTATAVVITDGMAMEVGVFDSAHYVNNTKLKSLTFPNYLDPAFTEKWKTMGDYVALPMEELPSDGTFVYSVAILPDVISAKYLDKDEMAWQENHIPDSDISEMYVDGDKLLTRKEVPKKRINSNLLSVKFKNTKTGLPLSGPLKKPALITLKHLHATEDHFEPTCVYWDGSAWSKDGCKVGEARKSLTVCECTHFSTFAVIMKVKEKTDDADRKMVVTVATVFGSFSILGLLICAIVAIVINYHQKDHMRIALNIDVALLLSQLVFFIGLSTGDNSFFSKPKTCEVVNPFVHFFELAALTWLLMEGLYYYSTLKPLFNDKNTVPIVFYFAVGWGLPVAFASACAEYAYPHFGNPERSEFCWMFIRGSEAWYFGAPVLILVLLNLVARTFIVKEIACWEDDPDDIRIERVKTRLMTSSVIMLVIVMTWLFGVLAVNHTEDKIYHYLFIVFYTFQGLVVLLFYCIRNQEMWDYRKEKKDEEEREKNKTYDFVYHP